ncbi:MAG TPA: dTDP-4-dehydrorhamnose reductase [Acetobacteraceae bacterium]|nr:dTDP-4-dehydrorhamnose reductase [Acetobacteraceae bacterium]
MTARPILVTGGSGQVASMLRAAATLPVRVAGRPDFDFDRPVSIAAVFHAAKPWLVVNAAAYTAVDAAEKDEAAAYRANRDGPAELARLCAAARIPLIHISTDYVFDGGKGAPYVETDPVAPQCVYGASKLAGEQAVQEACPRVAVLRTSWVYAPAGKNFVLTMLKLGQTRDRLTVVADQKGCPTAAADLAAAILAMAGRIGEAGWKDDYSGIFHAAGSGWTTWHGLATAVFEEARRHGAQVPRVDPIATADWPTPARRPADSRLDCGKLAAIWGIQLPEWRTSLRRTVAAIL